MHPRRRGQGLTEYAVIVGIVAIMLIGVVRSFSDKLEQTVDGSTRKIDRLIFDPMTDGPPRAEPTGE